MKEQRRRFALLFHKKEHNNYCVTFSTECGCTVELNYVWYQ